MHTVYKLYAIDGQLLYIGRTKIDLKDRLKNHKYCSPWYFIEVFIITYQDYYSYDLARMIEALSISLEQPKYNIQSKTGKAAAPRCCLSDLPADLLNHYNEQKCNYVP